MMKGKLGFAEYGVGLLSTQETQRPNAGHFVISMSLTFQTSFKCIIIIIFVINATIVILSLILQHSNCSGFPSTVSLPQRVWLNWLKDGRRRNWCWWSERRGGGSQEGRGGGGGGEVGCNEQCTRSWRRKGSSRFPTCSKVKPHLYSFLRTHLIFSSTVAGSAAIRSCSKRDLATEWSSGQRWESWESAIGRNYSTADAGRDACLSEQ